MGLTFPNPPAQFPPLLSGWNNCKILSASSRPHACYVRAAFHMCVRLFFKRPTCDGLSDSTGICRRPMTIAETMLFPKIPTTSPWRRGSRRRRPLPGYTPTLSTRLSGRNTSRWVARVLESRCGVTVHVTSLRSHTVAKAAKRRRFVDVCSDTSPPVWVRESCVKMVKQREPVSV